MCHQDYYLTPLALTGKNSEAFEAWVSAAVEGSQPATLIWQAKTLLGAGYELERPQQVTLNQQELAWTERVLLVRSLSLVRTQQASLERRLEAATAELLALTPAPARGKRQIRKRLELEQRLIADTALLSRAESPRCHLGSSAQKPQTLSRSGTR